jgi:hypothetical protein
VATGAAGGLRLQALLPSSGTDQLPRDRWQSPDVRLLRLASPTARFTYQIEPGG